MNKLLLILSLVTGMLVAAMLVPSPRAVAGEPRPDVTASPADAAHSHDRAMRASSSQEPQPAPPIMRIAGTSSGYDNVSPTLRLGWSVILKPEKVRAPEGWWIAGGDGPAVGHAGSTRRYTVEIADGLESRMSLEEFSARVQAILGDNDHGWIADGRQRLARTDDPNAAHIRVLLASPATVDRLCARAGLRTNGLYSCWNGEFAAINSERWFKGVSHVSDQELYRRYVINHEVGHGLGHSHRSCPGSGRLAPVMMQLTKSTYGCRPNPVPYP